MASNTPDDGEIGEEMDRKPENENEELQTKEHQGEKEDQSEIRAEDSGEAVNLDERKIKKDDSNQEEEEEEEKDEEQREDSELIKEEERQKEGEENDDDAQTNLASDRGT